MRWIIFFLLISLSSAYACPFCNPEVIKKQIVYDEKSVFVLYCLTPATKGNVLVIPKRHITRFEDLNHQEMMEIQDVINKMAQSFKDVYDLDDYVIIQKNGALAGQSVSHIHFHLIPTSVPFDQIVEKAFHYRERLTDEEMQHERSDLLIYFQS